MFRLLFFLFKIVAFVVLPFILLIRGSIHLHDTKLYPPSICLLGGMFLATIAITIYLVFFYGSITGEVGSLRRKLWMALILVLGYGIHGLFFFSINNSKTAEVKKEFLQLHPILRVSVSTLIHLDKSLIITDANRQPEDYRKMGMSSKKHSLHYRQRSGYVHALDIRTKGRGTIRNFLIRTYFRLMGFNTLRHGGTEDHLHISLLSHDRPKAI